MFKRKLAALEHANPETFDINSEWIHIIIEKDNLNYII